MLKSKNNCFSWTIDNDSEEEKVINTSLKFSYVP